MDVPSIRNATATEPPRAVRWGGVRGLLRTAKVRCYTVHWVDLGGGEGPPVILLHGLSGSSRWWKRNAPALAARHRVIAPDVIGFGRTRCPGRMPSIAELADVLAGWMEEVEIERAHVIGHSMGGQLAVHLAARHPERVARLVLVDSAGIPRPRPLAPGALARFALGLAPPRRWGDPVFLPVIAGDALVAGPRVILQAVGRILRDDVRPLLSRIVAPTLIVWGEHDRVIPLEHGEELREEIAGSRLLVVPQAAHNPMVDHPGAFNTAVLDFLAGDEVGE